MEHNTEGGNATAGMAETVLNTMAADIGKNLNKDEAIKEALNQGFQAGKASADTKATAAGAEQATKNAAKGMWASFKDGVAKHKGKFGIMLGVAGAVGATAAVKAYKERQGQNSVRMGDTTVAWATPGTDTAGGAAGGAPMGNDNGRGNRGGGR